MPVDYVEVGRIGYELSVRHGWNANIYVAKLAAEALEDGLIDEFEFWKAVELSLTPRAEP